MKVLRAKDQKQKKKLRLSFFSQLKLRLKYLIARIKYRSSTTKRERELDSINKKLQGAAVKQEINQELLKIEIIGFIRSKLNLTRRSKYIPFTVKNQLEVKGMVEAEYADRMKKYGVKINDKLQFV
ncbi:hypothetical protein SAMN05216480_10546 [Pustulibacterium marinum]|uniref:Uncharacterized protein n=1 Tax=Pustulibacterium marinum TaxID=1224947 RepID=A0A1I7GL28_9FLAO|nr:hypothetical protein [Pustulibacterium marinum]SFU49124.1 hypothetical protein SAMN05216480_10546 [Pustulibacterium marinum]